MATVRERVTDTIKVVGRTFTRRPRPVKPKYAGEKWTVNEIDRKSSRQMTPRGAMAGIQVRNGIWYPMVRPESQVMLTDMVWIVGATVDRSIEESTKGGYRFDPKFGAKCVICGAEYDSKPEECETEGCGGMEFEEADPKLLEPVNLLLDRPNWDDETQRVYKPTGDLLRDAVYYMLVIDDWHWEVVYDEAQETPAQLWPVNSEFMRQFADAGLTVGKYFCPECLERKGIGKATYDKEIEECPECNTTLLKTAWAQINENEEVVAIWAKQEILHDQARARGKRVLGRSKVLRCWAMAQILRWMEVHQWSLYSGQHDPANFITIPWMTQAEVNEMMSDWSKFQDDHPTYSGSMWLGLASSLNPEQKGGQVQVNNLMGSLVDLDAVNLAMHYTKAICMNFGVSPEMIGVQEAGKLGHPEEVLQVSYDTIQEIQTQLEDFVNYQLMPFFPEAAEQWVFKMNPPAPEDEKKKAEEALAWVNVLNALRQAGAEATLDPSIEKDWPIQIKSWREPMPPGVPPGGMPGEVPPGQQSETPPPGEPGLGPGEEDEPLPFPSFLARKGLVSQKPWVPYTGPHGGRGWRRGNEIRYQTEKPSELEPQGPSTPPTAGAGAAAESGYQRPGEKVDPRIQQLVDHLIGFGGRGIADKDSGHSAALEFRARLAKDPPESVEALGLADVKDLEREEREWTYGEHHEIHEIRKAIGQGKSPMLSFKQAYGKFLFAASRVEKVGKPQYPGEYMTTGETTVKRLRQARTDGTINAFRGLYADRATMQKLANDRDATVLLKDADSWSFDPGVAAVFALRSYQGLKKERDSVILHFEASPDDIISGWPFTGYMHERELVIEGKSFGREFEATHVQRITFGQLGEELVDDPQMHDELVGKYANPAVTERECWFVTIRKKPKGPRRKAGKKAVLDLTEESNDYALQRAMRGKDWPWYEESEPNQPTKQKADLHHYVCPTCGVWDTEPFRHHGRPAVRRPGVPRYEKPGDEDEDDDETEDKRLRRKAWTAYTGPQGGHGWRESTTGEIRYQRDKPRDGAARPQTSEPRRPAAPEKPPLKPGEVDLEVQPTPENLKQWVEQAKRDPGIVKATEAIAKGEFSVAKYRHTDRTYDPERQKLHDEIAQSMLNPKAKAAEGETPKVVFLLGQPASGKTTVLGKYAEQLGSEWTWVSADNAKKKLPEYQGWNAALLHEESSDIAEGMVRDMAVKERHHIVMDWTGANVVKVKREVDRFAEAGYDITVLYVDVPVEASVFRAYKRFHDDGRYVPLNYITDSIDKKPLQSYHQLREDPAVKHWAYFDNSGHAVKIVDAGERDPKHPLLPDLTTDVHKAWMEQARLPRSGIEMLGDHSMWSLGNKLDPADLEGSIDRALEAGEEEFKEFRIYRKFEAKRDNSALNDEERNITEMYRGQPHQCWYNAQLAVVANPRLTYVEGIYTSADSLWYAIPHGWVELDGKVLDLTLNEIKRSEGVYYGVPFKREDVLALVATPAGGGPIAVGPRRRTKRPSETSHEVKEAVRRFEFLPSSTKIVETFKQGGIDVAIVDPGYHIGGMWSATDPLVVVDKNTWNRMDDKSREMVVAHEIAERRLALAGGYKEARAAGRSHSSIVGQYHAQANQLLASQYTREEWLTYWKVTFDEERETQQSEPAEELANYTIEGSGYTFHEEDLVGRE